MRINRENTQLRHIDIKKNWNKWADGSAWVKWGDNIISVTASLVKRVPRFLMNKRSGWLTVEYRMLPRATSQRKTRNESQVSSDPRQVEISRMLGRVLRNTVNIEAFPGKTLWIDCDVIQADGGTRIASLIGAFIALYEALKNMQKNGLFTELPIRSFIAGVSVGILDKKILVDPDYDEDSSCDVDLNIIMNNEMEIIELQGGAEGKAYSKKQLDNILELVIEPIKYLIQLEKDTINE
ncbi:ribonuclease PH [bacterium]|nr:ribonuclease PH [bacterium]